MGNKLNLNISPVDNGFRVVAKFKALFNAMISGLLVDRVGLVLKLNSLSLFKYYTFWVIILPILDSDHFVHKYFLPQEYAILIHAYVPVAVIYFLSICIAYVMLESKKKNHYREKGQKYPSTLVYYSTLPYPLK
ncbi:dolichol-phosphate mannose synthase subunit 2-like [Solanum lycopersicum]|uniref:dolichol-phosphate mannose synthase subunit 2-like n=1 Tax=Solanum lycopersicum TaxID=4081 RepID=UPI0002BCA3F2|nr:dolichol-phosphate mannose synthase subunit 2-like [Solanum lycopersicum]